MEIPSIHVEDTSQGHQAYNNYDVLRKINALLENKLDLSTIPGMTLPTEQSTGMAAVHGAMGSQTVHPQQHTIQPPVVNTNYQAHTPQMTSPMQMSALPPSDAWASYLNSLNALQTGGLAVGGSSQPGSHHSSMQDVYQAVNIPATAPLSAMVAQQAAIMSGAMSPGAVMNRNTGGVTGGPTHQTHCDNWLDLASQAITPFTLSQVAAASAALAHNQQQQQQQQQILQQQQQQQQIQHQQQQHQLQQQQQYLQQQQQSNFYQQPCLQTQQQQQQHLQHQQQQVNFNQQASTYTSQPTQYPASVSLPVVPVSQSLLSANSESFIPGAISNRTLETLTESTMRPYRAIKGEANNYSCATGQSEPRNSPGNVGTIGDRQSPGSDGQSMSRSTSPADSDTSGYNSSQSEFSDSALVELMKSLQLTTNGNTEGQSSASQQQYYQQENINQLASLASSDLLKSLGLAPDTCKRLQSGQNSSYGTQTAPANPNDFSMSADLFASRPWNALNSLFTTSATDPNSIERAAKLYRNAAIICEPTCTWSGQLPPKVHKNPTYSCKVFLGGVPWDISENGLQHAFRSFGNIKIEWPSKDGRHPRYPPKAGYVYILFDNERAVKALLQACTHDFSNGGEYYFKISSRRMRSKEVQVIPWSLNDSNFVKQPSQRLDPQKTVFVGALHGMMNAEGLAHIMHDLFGNVLYAGIDTDKHKYPIGSGRVTFSSHKSYMKAVNAAFVEIKTSKFTKKIQIDPYLEDSKCSACNVQQGPYFCRDLSCFRYYCKACWQWYHAAEGANYHKPLMRNGRAPSGGVSGFNGPS